MADQNEYSKSNFYPVIALLFAVLPLVIFLTGVQINDTFWVYAATSWALCVVFSIFGLIKFLYISAKNFEAAYLLRKRR